MGNSCFCEKIGICKEVRLSSCLNKQESIGIIDLNNIQNNVTVSRYEKIKECFEEGDNEKVNSKEMPKLVQKVSNKKKRIQYRNSVTLNDPKYEAMIKRLLDQKKIKRNGPKRRETTRINNNTNLISIVNDVKKEHNEIKENNEEDKNIEKENNRKGSINSPFINLKEKNNFLLSRTTERNPFIMKNNLSQKNVEKLKINKNTSSVNVSNNEDSGEVNVKKDKQNNDNTQNNLNNNNNI